MNTFPLIRSRWSNEHISAAVFCVVLLYLLPHWFTNPKGIVPFGLLLLLGLFIDAGIGFMRYRQPVCAVSAAVTTSMLYVLAIDVPLWGQTLGVIVALSIGKHLWGGTGKNILNPAMTGFVFLAILFPITFPIFNYTHFIIPAVLLSLPFIKYRPFASLGFLFGMILWLIMAQQLSLNSIIGYGVVFWACLVVTDPVTVTFHPVYGVMAGLLGSFLPLFIYPSPMALAIGVLLINGYSAVVYRNVNTLPDFTYRRLRIKNLIHLSPKTGYIDLTGGENYPHQGTISFTEDKILERIQANEVYGLGGGGYSTIQKIWAVKASHAEYKHLVINGVECDPGLVHDQWLVQQHPNEIWKGVSFLAKCADFASITIAVKQDLRITPPRNIKIYKASDYYPSGAEKNLIKDILGKELNPHEIPSIEGVLVLNIQTIYAVFEAVVKNKKADTKFITTADLINKEHKVVKVRHGMKIKEIIDAVCPNKGLVYWGGGLMQSRTAGDDDVVNKNVNFIASAEHPQYKESRLCSNCGRCIIYCQAKLNVKTIVELIDNNCIDEVNKFSLDHCIKCGSCSFVCMAGRNLSSRISNIK